MSSLAPFLPKIFQYAQGVSEPAAYDAIRSAAIRFCERTKLWRAMITPTLGATNPVTLTPPTDSVIHDIEVSRIDGKNLIPQTTQWLNDHYCEWSDPTFVGCPQYITQLSEDQVTLVPFGGTTLQVWVRLKPTQVAATLPDFLMNRYMDVIQAGALSKLLLPKQPFMNADLAGVFGSSFEQALETLSSQHVYGQQRAPARSRGRFF